MAILGNPGSGKSALGNLLIGSKLFEERAGMHMSESRNYKYSVNRCGVHLSLLEVDSFTNRQRGCDVLSDIMKALSPGPNVFLFVVNSTVRLTLQQISAVDKFVSTFGKNVYRHTIIVFTHLDDVLYDERDIYAEIENSYFHQFVKNCEQRIFILDNKDQNEEKRTDTAQRIIEAMSRITEQQGTYTRRPFLTEHRTKLFVGVFLVAIVIVIIVIIMLAI